MSKDNGKGLHPMELIIKLAEWMKTKHCMEMRYKISKESFEIRYVPLKIADEEERGR